MARVGLAQAGRRFFQKIQDTVAKIITNNIRENLNIENMDLAFTVFEKEKYYENGEHF